MSLTRSSTREPVRKRDRAAADPASAGEGRVPAAEVAVDLRMTEAQVRKTRVVHGRDPELGEIDLGRKVIADAIEPDERRRLARELADKHGMSSHQIAPLIGVSQMQAWRDLKATETTSSTSKAAAA